MIRLIVLESFTAPFFIINPSAPISNIPMPKMFIRGQYIDAVQQINSLQQPSMVTTDGYVVDMTKVGVSVNPIQQPIRQYVPQNAVEEAPKVYKEVSVPNKTDSAFSMENLIKVGFFIVLLFVFLKYVLPLIKSSIKK
jgi:hypothetical protein